MQFLESRRRAEELGLTASLKKLWQMADLVWFLLNVCLSSGLGLGLRSQKTSESCLSQADSRGSAANNLGVWDNAANSLRVWNNASPYCRRFAEEDRQHNLSVLW